MADSRPRAPSAPRETEEDDARPVRRSSAQDSYEPVADLLAKYAKRDPGKTAIVDLESGTAIDFGQLDRVAIDIAAYLKSKGIKKGSRVLVLSDECLEKLLIWFGVWRIGAVICPFNLEINEKQMVSADRRAEACADPLSQGDRR